MGKKKAKVAALAYKLAGGTALDGVRWGRITVDDDDVYFTMAEAMKDRGRSLIKARMADAQMLMFDDFNELWNDIKALKDFPPRNIASRIGWNGLCFAMPNGKVFSPSGKRAVAVYDHLGGCDQAGTLESWQENVCAPLAGQHLTVFLIMFMFVGPILKLSRRVGNIGVELAGKRGKGKSTLLYIAASVVGRPTGDGTLYWETMNTTVNATEDKALEREDMPMILDDASGFEGESTGAARAGPYLKFVMSLAHGQTKHRKGGSRGQRYRLAFLITTNDPISEVLESISTQQKGAAMDRLLTLDIGVRENRNFDFKPDRFANTGAFAAELEDAISKHFGTAMPAFLQALVNARADDEQALRDRIDRHVADFLDRCQIDGSDGSAKRVAESFGLAFAAGKLARRYKVLPKTLDVEEAALVAYRLFLASTERMSYRNRVLAFLNDPAFIDMDARGLDYVSDGQFERAPGVIKTSRDGRREHLVSKESFLRAFPDGTFALNSSDLANIFFPDGKKHKGTKRTIRKGKVDRLLVFRIDDDDDA